MPRFKTPIEAPEVHDASGRVFSNGYMPNGARGVPTFVSDTAPVGTGPGAYMWWQTFPDGGVTLWIEDGT